VQQEGPASEHRDASRRHQGRWYMPACVCGWQDTATDSMKNAQRIAQVKHLDLHYTGAL
jgi:hypothetical protein